MCRRSPALRKQNISPRAISVPSTAFNKRLSPHCTRLTTYVDTGTCTIVVFQETHAHAIDEDRAAPGGDEATERCLHRSQTKTTTHGSQVHMWAWHCCCAERTTCRILPISAFHFSFPFQFSVSAFHFSFQFPPFPLALHLIINIVFMFH